ncbi:aldehyde dehydrogenase family protein [Streptomyces sp. NPDC051576]|uniref:aldehyde dehydrogenase family protein n=1 Tax=Streptomyces sp. NPDC051576 TaxID=3155803 RepID=UPI00342F3D16
MLERQGPAPTCCLGIVAVVPPGQADDIRSTNLTRVHRVAKRLKAGGVYVNGARQNLPHTPFGGAGLSGYGKEGGRAVIDEFLRHKTVSIIEPE